MKKENPPQSTSSDNTGTIARNSFWYGIELFVTLGASFLTSVLVARVFGAERLGPYQYLVWLTNVTIAVGSVGLPATTRKYMAEYLNRGEAGVARAAYLNTLTVQTYIAIATSAIALTLVFLFGDSQLHIVGILLVTAMAPRIVAAIPSMANSAAEVMRRNTGPSLAGGVATTSLTLFGLWVGWGLTGVAGAVLVGNTLECGLKLMSVESWLGSVPRGEVSPELKRRMFSYSGQGLALMLLNVVVWDRSDLLILKMMNSDWRQVSFFSVAFNVVEKVLMLPASFGTSLGATMMAQYGRGQARLKEMTVDGGRYALLASLPLLVGLACLSPLVPTIYKESFRPMVVTLPIVALFAIPKTLAAAPTMLLQATEKQGFLIIWGCVCGVVDLGLDFLLTGHYGANGAAIANGTAQAMAMFGTWVYVWRTTKLDLRLPDFARIALSGAIMAAAVLAFIHAVPGIVGLIGAIAVGAAVWAIALRITGALKPEDANRIRSVGGQLPAAVRPHWNRLIAWLAPAGATA